MKRSAVVVAVAVLALWLPASGTNSVAQSSADHPLVGTWRWSGRLDDGRTGVKVILTFHQDGTGMAVTHDGTAYLTYLGAWEATGLRTAAFALETLNPDGSGMGLGGQIEISRDGASWINAPTGPARDERIERLTIDLPVGVGDAAATPSTVRP